MKRSPAAAGFAGAVLGFAIVTNSANGVDSGPSGTTPTPKLLQEIARVEAEIGAQSSSLSLVLARRHPHATPTTRGNKAACESVALG